MRFITLLEPKSDERQVLYLADERSFGMDVFLPSDFTLMTGCAYLGLDVSLTNSQIVNLSGFCPKDTWTRKELTPPDTSEAATILFVADLELVSGAGMYLYDNSQAYFDESNHWCYIELEPKQTPDRSVRFCKNAILSFCGDALLGVWIQLATDL